MKVCLTDRALENLYPTKRRGHASFARRTFAPLLNADFVDKEPVEVANASAAVAAVKAELCEPADDEASKEVQKALAEEKKSLEAKLSARESEFRARQKEGMADDEVERRESEIESLKGYLETIAEAEKRLGGPKVTAPAKGKEAKS